MKKLIIFFLLIALTANADSLSAVFDLTIDHAFRRVSGLTNLTNVGSLQARQELTNGTATDSAQVSQIFSVRATITSDTPAVYDLTSLAGGFGDSILFSRVKAMVVKNLSSGSSIIIGSGTYPWLGVASPATEITIPEGGALALLAPNAGFPVETDTNLTISTTAAVASFDLILLGN